MQLISYVQHDTNRVKQFQRVVSAVFLHFWISQGNAATQLRWEEDPVIVT